MNLNKIILLFVTTSIFAGTAFVESVENSIIPTIEQFESIDNLDSKKYSINQFDEIHSILDHKEERIRLVTYNMLFNLYDHNLDVVNRWPQRLPRIIELIEEMQPDIIDVQELYPDQLNDLLPFLENTFAFYSKPCEDGELNGIFYRKDRFEVMDSKVWFMTSTPHVPSSETLTMLQLKDLKTDKLVTVFNTHLAFGNINKRDFQAHFIAEQVEEHTKEMPAIVTGDMNLFPNRLDLEKLPFYDGDYIHRILTQGSLKDAKEVSILGYLGPLSTFSNDKDDVAPFKGTGTPGVFLDRIYVSKDVKVLIHAVQPGTVDGHFPSDHLPVLIDFVIR